MFNTTSNPRFLLLVILCAVICSSSQSHKAILPHSAPGVSTSVVSTHVNSPHQESLGLSVAGGNHSLAANDFEIMAKPEGDDGWPHGITYQEATHFDQHNRSLPWDAQPILFGAVAASDSNPASSTTLAKRKWLSHNMDVPFYVNINSEQVGKDDGREADFLLAIRNAAQTWNNVPYSNFNLRYAGLTAATSTGYNGINEVIFMNKGQHERGAVAQIWYKRDLTLVEADIWINDDHDWNASGTFEAHELDLQSFLVHEFGHWLVLGHSGHPDSVMFESLSGGIIKRTLHATDERGISAIYPCPTTYCTLGH